MEKKISAWIEKLRKKYHIDIGGQIGVVSVKDGILLKPLRKEENKGSLTEQLFGIFSAYASGQAKPTKKDITKATENGFTDGGKNERSPV